MLSLVVLLATELSAKDCGLGSALRCAFAIVAPFPDPPR
jgi:hypothetical protein